MDKTKAYLAEVKQRLEQGYVTKLDATLDVMKQHRMLQRALEALDAGMHMHLEGCDEFKCAKYCTVKINDEALEAIEKLAEG